jgi:hypothetical protein
VPSADELIGSVVFTIADDVIVIQDKEYFSCHLSDFGLACCLTSAVADAGTCTS